MRRESGRKTAFCARAGWAKAKRKAKSTKVNDVMVGLLFNVIQVSQVLDYWVIRRYEKL